MLLPTGKCGTSLAWCWTFLASKVGSFLASADTNQRRFPRRCPTCTGIGAPFHRNTQNIQVHPVHGEFQNGPECGDFWGRVARIVNRSTTLRLRNMYPGSLTNTALATPLRDKEPGIISTRVNRPIFGQFSNSPCTGYGRARMIITTKEANGHLKLLCPSPRGFSAPLLVPDGRYARNRKLSGLTL
jgi:hypothetical protein